MKKESKRKTLIIAIQLAIAALFILGADKNKLHIYILYQSYFADIFLPFGFYFLLSLLQNQNSFFRNWWTKSMFVFSLCSASEILQYFGFFALARTFDPIDFFMYAIGAGLAAIIDIQIFSKYISFWKQN